MHSLHSTLTAGALLFLLLGCGDFEDYRLAGAADGDAAGDGASGQLASGDGGRDGPANEPSVASPSKPDPDGSPGGCSAPGTFYEDRDKDGFGGPVTTRACSAPPGYVSQGGDCHDGNADVFPSQSKLFTAPYTVAGGGISFDFDCDGKETVDPTASVSRTTSTCTEGSVCNQASNGQDCWVPTTAFGATRCGQGRLICSHPFGWQDRPRVGCR